jgi:molecular chaperone Hsp33
VSHRLRARGAPAATAALQDGQVEVHCEFCGKGYRFDAPAVAALFAPGPAQAPEPPGLQ